jgi:cell shape-determining protein MreC
MSHIRFNHIFLSLMFLAALAVFVLPTWVSRPAQAHLQFLFTPIAKPTRALAGFVYAKVSPPRAHDDGSPNQPRSPQELLQENLDLRMQLATITAQLDQLKELNADRQRLGPLRERCTPVSVSSYDAGPRESLSLSAGSQSGLRQDQAVLAFEGVVGRLTDVSLTASRVQLITDKGVRVKVSFERFEKDSEGHTKFSIITYPTSVAVAQGSRKMIVTNQPWKELKDALRPNDWAVLDDTDWPKAIMNYRVAKVTEVVPQSGTPGFGEIHLETTIDLPLLPEVMVLTK